VLRPETIKREDDEAGYAGSSSAVNCHAIVPVRSTKSERVSVSLKPADAMVRFTDSRLASLKAGLGCRLGARPRIGQVPFARSRSPSFVRPRALTCDRRIPD